MANRLSHFIVDHVAREKCKDFCGEMEIRRDVVGFASLLLLFEPLVLSFLEEFHLMLFNSIGFRFVIQKFDIVGVSLRV